MLEILNTVWRPIVEILILAVAIQYVFSFVRGTRGFSILTGKKRIQLGYGRKGSATSFAKVKP